MVYRIINQAEMQKAIREQIGEVLSCGRSEDIASYNHRRRWEPDQEAIDGLRNQVRDYLLDHLADLLEKALDYAMDPTELIGEFYDLEPEDIRVVHRRGSSWMDDSVFYDMEHDRRRDDNLTGVLSHS